MLNWMIQLHYLKSSSEITPFGNEPGQCRGGSSRPAPVSTQPWDSSGCTPLSRAASQELSLELRRCRISARVFMLSMKCCCLVSNAFFFSMDSFFLATTQIISDLGSNEWTGTRRRSMWRQLLSVSLQDSKAWRGGKITLVFSLRHLLCVSWVQCLKRQLCLFQEN